MPKQLQSYPKNGDIRLTRREFLWLASMSAAGVAIGCATNPVTGKSQLMLMSESQEIEVDKQYSPNQFSADYGPSHDKALNDYLQQTGKKLSAQTHRPQMPYSFRSVNATYVNAYAFPGGSIAATRGILLSLESEAELAALLGHELGHVNARHTAEQMSKGTLTQLLVIGAAVAAGTQGKDWGQVAQIAGMIGGSALLAKYSRDNEREADALGMEYMVRGEYSPQGMVELMDMLKGLSKEKAGISQALFATHPMSMERYRTAVGRVQSSYVAARNYPIYRERYMDMTADLRNMKGAIENMQKAEVDLAKKKYPQAEDRLKRALNQAPNDYAGLMMMSKCLLAQNKNGRAKQFADKAKQVYPQEAQANLISGIAAIRLGRFDAAFNNFEQYEKRLPGNPSIAYLKGRSLEGMHRRQDAAEEYYRYLQIVNQGDPAKHAYQRLVQWGYIKPQ